MIRKFIASFTLLSYLIISMLSTGTDVLCIHGSGYSSFEVLVASECLEYTNHKDESNTKLSFSKALVDKCNDLALMKDLRSNEYEIFSSSLLSTNTIISDYIKYIKLPDLTPDKEIYISKIENQDLVEQSNITHISTFVLTI